MFISPLNSGRGFLLCLHSYYRLEILTPQTVSVNLSLPFLLTHSEKLPGHQDVKKSFTLPWEGQKLLHKA